MKLKDAIIKAYDTHWSMINTFTIQFDFPFRFNNLLKHIYSMFNK